MTTFQRSLDLVQSAVEAGRLAGAALAIGDRDRLFVEETFGYTSFAGLTGNAPSVDCHTLYDMASVSKIMATLRWSRSVSSRMG